MRHIGGVVVFALVAVGCTGFDLDVPPSSAVVPPGCDTSQEPKDAPACVVNEYGIFVSGTGTTDGPGTKESPVNSINAALNIATSSGKPRIYVCSGTYTEHVNLAGSTSINGIYGGFDCGTWQYGAGKTIVAPTDPGPSLMVSGVSSVTISDMEFNAQSAANLGESSIAAFVLNANVTFVRDGFVAGNGNDGTSGQTGSNFGNANALNGNPAQGTTGGQAQNCSCNNGETSTGGSGGNGAPSNGKDGTPDLGAAGCEGCGSGGVANQSCGDSGAGQWGAFGDTGADGAGRAAMPPQGTITSAFGSLDGRGWLPAMSEAGIHGNMGQGGGGGGGGNTGSGSSGGGGGGGCGGCGGAAGSSAQSGGASIALLSFESTITLKSSSLSAGNGGKGGSGAKGQVGQYGGNGGAGVAPGCSGGGGGTGGAGGASAGGAGGISVGVLWLGAAPTLDAATNFKLGSAGAKGIGGNPGANDGPDGVAGAMLQVTP